MCDSLSCFDCSSDGLLPAVTYNTYCNIATNDHALALKFDQIIPKETVISEATIYPDCIHMSIPNLLTYILLHPSLRLMVLLQQLILTNAMFLMLNLLQFSLQIMSLPCLPSVIRNINKLSLHIIKCFVLLSVFLLNTPEPLMVFLLGFLSQLLMPLPFHRPGFLLCL